MLMLHLSEWAWLNGPPEAPVRAVRWPAHLQGNEREQLPLFQIAAANVRPPSLQHDDDYIVSKQDRSYRLFVHHLSKSLSLVCAAVSQPEDKSPMQLSIGLLTEMMQWFNIPSAKVHKSWRVCGGSSSKEIAEARKRRGSLALLWTDDWPLMHDAPAAGEKSFTVSSDWHQFRSLILLTHGITNTIPFPLWKAVQTGLLPPASDFMLRGAFVVSSSDKSTRGVTWASALMAFVVSWQSSTERTDHDTYTSFTWVQAERNTSDFAQLLEASAGSDIVVTRGTSPAEAILGLPPWGGVLEVLDSSQTRAPTDRRLAGLLGLAHAVLDLRKFEAIENWLPLNQHDEPNIPLQASIFSEAVLNLSFEVKTCRLKWLQPHL